MSVTFYNLKLSDVYWTEEFEFGKVDRYFPNGKYESELKELSAEDTVSSQAFGLSESTLCVRIGVVYVYREDVRARPEFSYLRDTDRFTEAQIERIRNHFVAAKVYN